MTKDWNGKDIVTVTSRGGTLAVADYCDNLILDDPMNWPHPAITQKLYQSRKISAFDASARQTLEAKLGYYCDLQSLNSEDAVTWSYFGPLLSSTSRERAEFMGWLLGQVGLNCTNTLCNISLWRRVAHPDTLVPGGPEIDFMIQGDRCVILGEAKWGSSEGMGQGVNRDKGQLQLRAEFLEKYGRSIFGDRQLAVLMLSRDVQPTVSSISDGGGVVIRNITWEDLLAYADHPKADEFRRYYEWKCAHSKQPRRNGETNGP